MTKTAAGATCFRAPSLAEESDKIRPYLQKCRERLVELGQIDNRPPETPQERALRAAQRSEAARVALRANGPAALARFGVGIAQADLILNGLERLPLVLKVADWWRTSTKPFCVLGGKSGTGKTIAAMALIPEVCARCITTQSGEEFWSWEAEALVLPALEISQLSLFERTDRSARERAKTRTLLILDDLGAEMNTDMVKQTVLEVLDARMANARKTIITTNLEGKELRARYQGRVLRRLEEGGVWLSGNVDGRRMESPAEVGA